MKPVTPNVVPPVQMVGHGIQISLLRQRMVKGRVKDGNLGKFRPQDLPRSPNALDVVGIVKRCKVNAVFDPFQHFVGDDGRLRKHFAAMDHPMPHGVDVSHALHLGNARLFRRNPSNQVLQCCGKVGQRRGELLPGRFVSLDRDNRLAANALHLSPADALIRVFLDALAIRRDELKLQAGTSRIQYENVHDRSCLCPVNTKSFVTSRLFGLRLALLALNLEGSFEGWRVYPACPDLRGELPRAVALEPVTFTAISSSAIFDLNLSSRSRIAGEGSAFRKPRRNAAFSFLASADFGRKPQRAAFCCSRTRPEAVVSLIGPGPRSNIRRVYAVLVRVVQALDLDVAELFLGVSADPL